MNVGETFRVRKKLRPNSLYFLQHPAPRPNIKDVQKLNLRMIGNKQFLFLGTFGDLRMSIIWNHHFNRMALSLSNREGSLVPWLNGSLRLRDSSEMFGNFRYITEHVSYQGLTLT